MGKYDDMINLPHPTSKRHPPMSRENRAAQFAPFAALTGYDDAVKEVARYTSERISLTDEQISVINAKLAYLNEHMEEDHHISIVFFLPDAKKQGGSYETASGIVCRIDAFERIVMLSDKTIIPMKNIISIEGDVFSKLELE